MIFHSCSRSADRAIEKFIDSSLADTDIANKNFHQKLEKCDFQLLLVTLDGPDRNRLVGSSHDFNTLNTLFAAWRAVTENSTNMDKQKQAWRIIDGIGAPLQTVGKTRSTPILRRFKTDSEYNQYFVLLSGLEPQGIPVADLGPLCNIWQLKNGHLPLHAAGVIHKDQLFVFTGPSGAGKSTATMLSQEIGDTTLDEDQLLICKSATNGYHADAWGYGLASCNLPIRVIFKLIQNTEDKIIPLQPLKFARLLFERHHDIVGNQFSADLLKHSFAFIAGLARQIAGYELHFRKSPDFWKLIDERFPQ